LKSQEKQIDCPLNAKRLFRMLVILNAGARSAARDPSETRSKVAAMFGAAGVHPQIIVAAGKEVGAIARQAVAENEKTIVAGGGDGTVSTVAAELGPESLAKISSSLSLFSVATPGRQRAPS
jgi:diacylglycerol kinase family enzyme